MNPFSKRSLPKAQRMVPFILLCGVLAPLTMPGQAHAPRAAHRSPTMESQSPASPGFQGYGFFKSRIDNGPYAKVIFRNDLDLLIKEHHGTPLASVTILIRTLQPAASPQVGLLERLAAMALFPTENEIVATPAHDSLAMLGGEASLSVTPDSLRFTVTLPANKLAKIYPTLARHLDSGPLDTAALSLLLNQLRDERQKDLPNSRSRDLFLLAGADGSLAIPSQPSSELLQSLNQYLKRVVNAAHIVLTVVGDVDRERVIRGMSENFLSLPFAETNTETPKTAAPFSPTSLQYHMTASPDGLAELAVYFPMKAVSPAASDVLSAMLTDGHMSALGHALVYRHPVALSATSGLVTTGRASYFGVHLSCRADQLDETSVLFFAKLRQFSETEPTPDELLRARRQFELNWYLENRSPADISRTLAEFESGPGYLLYTKTLSSLDSVSAAEIQELARNLANDAHPIIVERWPAGHGTRIFTSQTYQDFLALAVPRAYAKLGKRLEQASADLASVKVKPPAYVGNFDRSQVKSSPWNRYSILRGPNVYVSEYHLSPLVTIEALYSGGQLTESRSGAGLTALMVQTAIQSLKNKTSDELWFHLESMGATLFPIVKDDLYGYGLTVPSSMAESAIDLLMEIVLNPQFTPDEVAEAKSYLLEHWKAQMESPASFSKEKVKEAFFVHTTLYPPVADRIADVQKASEKDVKAWWNNLQSDAPPTLLILGDTEGTELVSPFARKLSSSKWKMSPLATLTSIKTPKLPLLTQETHPAAPMPLLQLGFGGPNFASPKTAAMEFAQTLFKGIFDQSSVSDFYYLRLFDGVVAEATPGNPSDLSEQVWKRMSALIASDDALNAGRARWTTDRTLRNLNPITKGIDFYRRSLFSPDVDTTQKTMQDVSQWTSAQWREAIQSIFNTQNLITCYTTPPANK